MNVLNKIETQQNMAVVLGDTLALLSEVSEYLKRLPHVPTTKHLLDRVESHLQDPKSTSATRIANLIESEAQKRSAALYTPEGVVMLQIETQGAMAYLKSEHKPSADKLVEMLHAGCAMRLHFKN